METLPAAETETIPSIVSFFDQGAGDLFKSAYRLITPHSNSSVIRYQVVSRSNGFVEFVLSMPEVAMQGFIDTLVAVSELTRAMNWKAKCFAAQDKPVDLQERQERQAYFQEFEREAGEIYDRFISQGMDEKEAVRATRAALKDKEYAFATYEIVKDTLRKIGRFQKVRFRRR